MFLWWGASCQTNPPYEVVHEIYQQTPVTMTTENLATMYLADNTKVHFLG